MAGIAVLHPDCGGPASLQDHRQGFADLSIEDSCGCDTPYYYVCSPASAADSVYTWHTAAAYVCVVCCQQYIVMSALLCDAWFIYAWVVIYCYVDSDDMRLQLECV
jgi:hypothetical protein